MAHSLSGLMKWVDRKDWSEPFAELLALHFEPACEAVGISVEELPDILDQHHSDTLWGCVFEDFLTSDMQDGSNIADEYLKRRGWKESPTNKRYIAALRSSVMSLYEVSDIVLDQSFLARDLLRGGEPVRVSERSATRYFKPWDRIAARIVPIGDRFQMSGGALRFRHEASEKLLDAFRRENKAELRRVRKRGDKTSPTREAHLPPTALSDTETLREIAMVFTFSWLEDTLQCILQPRLPQLSNTDGEAIEFTTITYPLSSPPQADAIARALNSLTCLRPEGEAFWNWIETPKRAKPKRSVENSVSIMTRLDDGSTSLGTIELKEARLILQTNSRGRATRGQALLEPVLAALVGVPTIELQEVADITASAPTGETQAVKRQSTLLPDEERAITHAFLDKYYADLLDQPVPVLGNISPRRASRTAKGREKLVTWLKLMENMGAKRDADSPMANYDYGWIWQALGVSDLRR
jgi:hypothetical protein